ncbi:MAG: hypothetical protein KAJ01_03250, partial [Candidatus Hydrogenedentes bacterium]|nr:hypothetical protein [Candidatus Hydrogenedentota bacterium]
LRALLRRVYDSTGMRGVNEIFTAEGDNFTMMAQQQQMAMMAPQPPPEEGGGGEEAPPAQ